jgi:hypothetical protein
MDNIEKERKLFAKYPPQIVLLVKMAQQALREGRAEIIEGKLVFKEAPPSGEDKIK